MVNFGVCQLDFQVTHSITEGNQWRSLKQKPIKQHWLLPAYGYLSHVAQAHLSREWPVHSGLPLLHHYAIKKWPIKEPTDQTDEATPPLRVSLLGCVKLAITGTHHICHWKAEKSRRSSPNASMRAVWNKRSVRTDSMSQEVLSSWSAMKSLLSFSRYLCLLNPDKII